MAWFFILVKAAQENLSKLVLDKDKRDANGYFHPWPNILRIPRSPKAIDILDRKSIMAGFRETRLNLADFPNFMLPQHRRMMYIAGAI